MNSGKEESDEEEEDDENAVEDPEKKPKLKVASIKHNGPINRIRCKALGSTMVAATWGENGIVGIYGLNRFSHKQSC